MANNNNPHGLKPLGYSLSGAPCVVEIMTAAAAYGTAIFMYDAVNQVAGGALQASATPGTTLYSGVSLDYGAASVQQDHIVFCTPDAVFECQDDGTGSGIIASTIGQNANLVLTAGNAQTKVSKHQIAASTIATTSTLDVKLLRLLNVPTNSYGVNAVAEIAFNKHRYGQGVAGV